MRTSLSSLLTLCALLHAAACGGDDERGDEGTIDSGASPDGGGASDGGGDAIDGGGVPDADVTPDASTALRPMPIWVIGNPIQPLPHLIGSQTPSDYSMGISRLELMRAVDDADPELAFDLGAGLVVPMEGSTRVAVADLADIAPGTYTHLRVRLTQAQFTVAATAHVANFSDNGNVTITAALADTTIDGEAWPKGKGRLKYVGLVTQESDVAVPPLPTPEGVTLVETASETFLILPINTPLVLTEDATNDPAAATITFYTGDSFVWSDRELENYQADIWDVSTDTALVETVVGFGARSYVVAFGEPE